MTVLFAPGHVAVDPSTKTADDVDAVADVVVLGAPYPASTDEEADAVVATCEDDVLLNPTAAPAIRTAPFV